MRAKIRIVHWRAQLAACLRRDRGALSIELVGIVPLIVLATLLSVQGLLLTSLLPAVQQASRDGARAASMGQPVGPAVSRALPDWATLERIETGNTAQTNCAGHCVRVFVRAPLGVPSITWSNLTIDRVTEMPR